MYVRTHTQISIALQCQQCAESLCAPCWVSHHAFEYVWWMCWQSHRWRSIPYCLFCFMFDLRCSAIFIHFHTQVGQDKVHKNGECHYIFHLLSHHVTWQHLLVVCMFWWWGDVWNRCRGHHSFRKVCASPLFLTQKGLILVYSWPWFKFSSNSGNAFWSRTQI